MRWSVNEKISSSLPAKNISTATSLTEVQEHESSPIHALLEDVSKGYIDGKQIHESSTPEVLPVGEKTQKNIQSLNTITKALAGDIAEVALTANTIMEAIIHSSAKGMHVVTDQKTLDFFAVLKEFADNPLAESTKDIDLLWARLQKISDFEVPLPNEPWAESIQDFATYTKYQCMEAIASNTHITCLRDILTRLEGIDKETFIDVAEHHLRFAMHSNDFLGDSDVTVKAKEELCLHLGQMFLRAEKAEANNTSRQSAANYTHVENISSANLLQLTALCMESSISMEELFAGVESACAHMTALSSPQGSGNSADAAARVKTTFNAYLDGIFDAKGENFPTRMRYVDALFQHMYPEHQELALEIKKALAPLGFSFKGIIAQHSLTLGMQSLMHAIDAPKGMTRTKTLQRAATSASGSVPAFWLTPETVKTITQSRVENVSFRLAYLALLQMEAHNEGGVIFPFIQASSDASMVHAAEHADGQTAEQADEQVDEQVGGQQVLSQWQDAEKWCAYLGLMPKAEQALIALHNDAEKAGLSVAGMTLDAAQALFQKGLESKHDLALAHQRTRSAAKIVSSELYMEKQKKLYTSMDAGVGVRMAMRDALTAILHTNEGEHNEDITELNIERLGQAIKQRSEEMFPPFSKQEHPLEQQLRHDHGRVHVMREFLYQRSLLRHKSDDFITFNAHSAERKHAKGLVSEISFFAPHLSRARQTVCNNILEAHEAFIAFVQDPHDAERSGNLRTKLGRIRNIDPSTLKDTSDSEAVLGSLIDDVLKTATESNIQRLQEQFDYLVPRANAIRQYAPYKDNPLEHGRISTLLRGAGQSIKRKDAAISNWINLKFKNLSSLSWRINDKVLGTEKVQHVQKATCLAILQVFAQTEILAGSFSLANEQVQNDIAALLQKWGLDTNDTIIHCIMKRCLLDFTNADKSIDLQSIEKRAHGLMEKTLKYHEREQGRFIGAAHRAKKQAVHNNFQTATHEAFSALLDELSIEGGGFVYSRNRGIKFDVSAIHSVRGKNAKKNKKYLLPVSANAEVMNNKGIAIMPVGTGFRVVFKNTVSGGGGASGNWTMASGDRLQGAVGVNVKGLDAEGVAVDFDDKASCLEFLELLTPGSQMHEKQSDIQVHNNIFSKAKEVQFIDAEGASVSATASFAFLGFAKRLSQSTVSFTPSVSLALVGGYTMEHQKNAHGEVMRLTNQFAATATGSMGVSRSKNNRIHEETGVKRSSSRKKLSKSKSVGITFERTVEVHTKKHQLLESTCILWEVPQKAAESRGGIPSAVRKMIESNKDLTMDFYAAKAQNPQSWVVHYALKPEMFKEVNRLMSIAHVTQDTAQRQQYIERAHDLLCTRKSYTPTKLIAKCMVTNPVGNNTNRGFLAFQAIKERNSMMEKPIVISLLPHEQRV